MAEVKRGLDILVYVKGEGEENVVLGAQKNCSLSLESDTIDVSNKNSDGWSDFIAGTKSWTISCDGQFLTDDPGQDALMNAFINATFVDVVMKDRDEAGTISYTGKAMITSVELEASYDDVFAYTVEFQGKGALTIA